MKGNHHLFNPILDGKMWKLNENDDDEDEDDDDDDQPLECGT